MAKIGQCFIDEQGNSHATPESAIQADIETAIGSTGNGGIGPALARSILECRAMIEKAFADYDILKTPTATGE